MNIDRDDLDIRDLAAAAGVTTRTIRYYLQQGLLPSPGTRGPKTRYDRGLLDRLQLIKLLQRRHFPLSEIRSRLESLDDDGVRRALGSPPELPLGTSALGYARGLIGNTDEPRLESSRESLSISPSIAAAAADATDLFGNATSSPERRATRSTWERFALASDVELHVRRPLSREQNRRVDRLLAEARRILSEEP